VKSIAEASDKSFTWLIQQLSSNEIMVRLYKTRAKQGVLQNILFSQNFYHVYEGSIGVPPYPLIQYPRFQLSAVQRGPGKNWKIKEIDS
jgi:hypothetical protein